jgi:hypothetical protein
MNKKDKNILLALSLGDGYLRSDNKATLQIIHSLKQKEYIKYKADLLRKILNKNVIVQEFNNSGYPGVKILLYHKYFKCLRRYLYKNGKKYISKSVLSRMLDPQLIAIWYMDDGNIIHHKRNGKIHSREISLNTYCSEVEAILIQEWFISNFDIFFRVAKDKNKYRLICNTKNAKKFALLVEPFLIESMKYKIDFKYT